jgi:hypothetical protein
MRSKPRRIAILHHAADNENIASTYIVSRLAQIWRQDGHDVFNLFGISEFVPADLIFVHVDLSIVPEPYLEFARRYPIVINGEIADIRKSRYSTIIVKPYDQYDGPVIVKTDLNYAGRSESDRLGGKLFDQIPTPLHYPIYQRRSDMPEICHSISQLIVEKFLPEMDDGLFCVRSYRFFGDHGYWQRLKSSHPIVNSDSQVSSEQIEPDPRIMEWRVKLKMDYGKLDYLVKDGESVLLDANKTMGGGPKRKVPDPAIERLLRYRAEGLYCFFDSDRVAATSPWAISHAPSGSGALQ